jgi:hypothetical protein
MDALVTPADAIPVQDFASNFFAKPSFDPSIEEKKYVKYHPKASVDGEDYFEVRSWLW